MDNQKLKEELLKIVPRRNNIELNKPIEKMIRQVVEQIECMPANEKITEAECKLWDAFNLIADYFDENCT